jgi:ADP-ribosyl-[dinitrogen reductase] hydrolase
MGTVLLAGDSSGDQDMTAGDHLLARFQGCLAGVAIGDALGMPVELMSHAQIRAMAAGGITGFRDPVLRSGPGSHLRAGDTTDDWQLTAALARSLIRTGGQFDLQDCSDEHVREWRIGHAMWGPSTRSAIEEIADGRRHPATPARPTRDTGLSNGVIMKIAPLALLHGLHLAIDARFAIAADDLFADCIALGLMTHGDRRASLAAYAVAVTIAAALQGHFAAPTQGRKFLPALIGHVAAKESDSPEPRVSQRLALILDCLDDEPLVREKIGCGFTALDTAPFAIATFLRHPRDFQGGVLEAVNAGGDTDTNAAVVGALIGAHVGLEGIPDEWRRGCAKYEEAVTLAQQLFAVAQRRGHNQPDRRKRR